MKCPNCNTPMTFKDSHRSYESLSEYTVIKYWDCKECGEVASTESDERLRSCK